MSNDAAQAFVEVLRRAPEDDEAFGRLFALAEKWERPGDLERLLSFKLGHTSDPAARVALYAKRAALRAGPLDSVRGAIHDHRRILELDPGHLPSLRFLGRQALDQHRFDVAIPFCERALTRAAELGELEDGGEVELRLQLAAAHEGAGRHGDAIRALRAAIDAHPEQPGPRERLIALGLRRHEHALAIEQLQALEALTDDRSAKARLALRRGRLQRDQRKDSAAALAAFRTALELDPLGDAAAELMTTVGDGPLHPEDAAAANTVIAGLRAALAEDPLQVRRLECLRDLAGLRGLHDLRDVAAQLLSALGVGVARGRARDLSRAVPLPALGALGSTTENPTVSIMNEIWPHLCEGVARMFPADPADLGVSRTGRVNPGTDPRLAWAESASVALGIPSLQIYLGSFDELAVAGFDVPETCLVLGRGVMGGDPSSRFRVGRALALVRQRATVLERIPISDLELAWAAAGFVGGARQHPRYDAATLKGAAKRLSKGLSRRELKSLESYAETFTRDALDVNGWRQAVLRTADRFGLLAGGDLAMALRVMTGGVAAQQEALRAPAALDLIHFALGERYAGIRREAGLSRDQ